MNIYQRSIWNSIADLNFEWVSLDVFLNILTPKSPRSLVARYYLTDAEILPGNSGGAAIDSEGNYFGIPSAVTIVQSPINPQPGAGIIFPIASQLAASDIVGGSDYLCENPQLAIIATHGYGSQILKMALWGGQIRCGASPPRWY
jgi:hypothetical protein